MDNIMDPNEVLPGVELKVFDSKLTLETKPKVSGVRGIRSRQQALGAIREFNRTFKGTDSVVQTVIPQVETPAPVEVVSPQAGLVPETGMKEKPVVSKQPRETVYPVAGAKVIKADKNVADLINRGQNYVDQPISTVQFGLTKTDNVGEETPELQPIPNTEDLPVIPQAETPAPVEVVPSQVGLVPETNMEKPEEGHSVTEEQADNLAPVELPVVNVESPDNLGDIKSKGIPIQDNIIPFNNEQQNLEGLGSNEVQDDIAKNLRDVVDEYKDVEEQLRAQLDEAKKENADLKLQLDDTKKNNASLKEELVGFKKAAELAKAQIDSLTEQNRNLSNAISYALESVPSNDTPTKTT